MEKIRFTFNVICSIIMSVTNYCASVYQLGRNPIVFNKRRIDTNINEKLFTYHFWYYSVVTDFFIKFKNGAGFPLYCCYLIRNKYKKLFVVVKIFKKVLTFVKRHLIRFYFFLL